MKHNDTYNCYSIPGLYTWYKDHIDFSNKKILDFGGGFGNLIRSADGIIESKNYTVIDVDKEAIEKGRIDYPEATWIHADLYNPVYNPKGIDEIIVIEQYDLIFAYSVFTHTSYEDLKKYIDLFKDNGQIAITFLSVNNKVAKKYFYQKRIDEFNTCDDFIFDRDINYLVDNKICLDIPRECSYLLAWYDESVLEQYGIIKNSLPQDLLII
jgi:2-polyprenyl-3-methyl-5-hydroxy-6-metoxy-1,4-benzoquinol methylase